MSMTCQWKSFFVQKRQKILPLFCLHFWLYLYENCECHSLNQHLEKLSFNDANVTFFNCQSISPVIFLCFTFVLVHDSLNFKFHRILKRRCYWLSFWIFYKLRFGFMDLKWFLVIQNFEKKATGNLFYNNLVTAVSFKYFNRFGFPPLSYTISRFARTPRSDEILVEFYTNCFLLSLLVSVLSTMF